jgi:hypothetical protein
MDVPGVGEIPGSWDLRSGVDAYLGRLPFAGARVLEVGPASGFLTMEMEKRGASVIALEVKDDPGWDFVPFPAAVMAPIDEARRQHMARIKTLSGSSMRRTIPRHFWSTPTLTICPTYSVRLMWRSWARSCCTLARRYRSWSNAPSEPRP